MGDARTPILVGAGVAMQRFDEPLAGRDHIALTVDAVRAANADCRVPPSQIDAVFAMRGMWPVKHPAAAIARTLGVPGAHTVDVQPGVLQTTVFGRACDMVRDGKASFVLVAGGEAKYRDLRATITGATVEPVADGEPSNEDWAPHGAIISPAEIALRLVQATHHYALIENARRAADGLSLSAHAEEVAELWAAFNRVGQANTEAWNRQAMSLSEIADAGPKNRPLAFPYNKWHNSQWNVDQAGALLFTTVEQARKHAIPEHQWVYPQAIAANEHMVPVSERADIHRSPGFALSGQTVLNHVAREIDDVDYIDLYSCFPIAVRTQMLELEIPASRTVTITGGMTWAGGPLNNYVIQALPKLVQLLRSNPGSLGLVTAVSGMLTKQGVSLWSTAEPANPYNHYDVSSMASSAIRRCELATGVEGEATVASYTVLHDDKTGSRGIVVGDLADGRRVLVETRDLGHVSSMEREEWIGRRVKVSADGQIRR